jgi:hypothetical protein
MNVIDCALEVLETPKDVKYDKLHSNSKNHHLKGLIYP